ncbi:MAG: Fic family protein [Candidatus Hydrothermarchaeales archaeon]
MKLIKQQRGDKEYYYLKKSLRIGDKVKTFSKYIGPVTIPEEELKKDIEYNKTRLKEEIERYKTIHAPLEDLLTGPQIKKIEEIKNKHQKEIEKLTNIPKKKIYENFGIKFTYNSNAIEGSTVTEREALLILKDKVTPGGKTLIEIKEAENHQRAFEYILKEKSKVKKNLILGLHKIVSERLLGIYEGKFRDIKVEILGADVKTSEPENIASEINGLLRWYGKVRKKMHPLEAAAVFHVKFENIHPFRDYNGRVGRLLLNYMLLSEGYPMIIIPVVRREEYYAALNAGDKGNYKAFVKFLYDLIVNGT